MNCPIIFGTQTLLRNARVRAQSMKYRGSRVRDGVDLIDYPSAIEFQWFLKFGPWSVKIFRRVSNVV